MGSSERKQRRARARNAAAAVIERRAATPAERESCLGMSGDELPDFTTAGAPAFNPYATDGDIHAAGLDDAGGGQ